MSMQSQVYSISALSVELGHDRRTLAKYLDDVVPAQTDPDGTKRWRLRDVLDKIERIRTAEQQPSQPDKPETGEDRLKRLQAEELEIKIGERAGRLVSLADIEPLWAEAVIAARNELLLIPDRLKKELDKTYRINLDPLLIEVPIRQALQTISGTVGQIVLAGKEAATETQH